jgi:hypothetical protein
VRVLRREVERAALVTPAYRVKVRLCRGGGAYCRFCVGPGLLWLGLYEGRELVEGPEIFCRSCWRSWCAIASGELREDGIRPVAGEVLRVVWKRI